MLSNYYKYRIPITIDHTKIDEDLTHFPLKVVVSGTTASDIYEEIGSLNKNIAFKDEDDNQLYCEIEQTYDESGLSYVYHVSRSDWTISSATDTTIYFCYDGKQVDNYDYVGYAGDTASQNVWNSDFAAVYTMAQDPSGGTDCIMDSTINANHSVSNGAMTSSDLVTSKIGKSLYLDGIDDYIPLPFVWERSNQYSINILLNPTVLDTSDNSIVSGATSEFLLDFNDADSIRMRYNSDLIEYGIIAQEYENVISQICIVNTGGTLILYVNGENVSSYNISPSPAQISANIGARDGGNSCFYGEIFDVSFTVNSYLSADWIKTDYNSQTDQLNILGSPEIMTMPETVEEVEWTPAEITTSLWLDGSDVATITKDASNRVGQWDDKSGNNRHATETNDDYKPVYGGEQINGIDAVNFRPNKKVNIDPFGADSYTWFMVTLSEAHSNLSMMGATTTYVPIGQSGSTSTNVFRINGVDDPPGLKFLVNGETSQSITTRGGCNAALTASAGVLSVYENVPVITSSIRIGWGDFSNWYSNAYFGEVLCLPGTPSVDDRQKIEGYLAHKWALEANLPAGHPYESAAPTTYVDKIPTYYFEGTVIGGISQYVERNIRLYRYDTGELMNTTTSVSGSFFITTTHSGTHYITCHDLPYGEYNDLIFGKITPGITYITPGITYD